jgi:hypothetical protein
MSIELSGALHQAAADALVGVPNLTLIHGSSPEVLKSLKRSPGGGLFWLDAHWSGLDTAGSENPCPVIEEIRAIGAGHPSDCLLIDDARLFNHPAWPSLFAVMSTIKEVRPGHHVTVIHDLIVAVPATVQPVVDAFARYRDATVVRASEVARVGPRRALFNRILVHPGYLWILRSLVGAKQRLTAIVARPDRSRQRDSRSAARP